jgi:dihydrofolate reductase
MGRVVLWMQQSLDGFTQGPNGEFDWPVVTDDTHTYFNEQIERTAGAFLYGRRTFEMMASFWPTVVDSEHANTARFARLWVPMPKFVFSNTLEQADWNATVVCGDLVEQVTALKETTERDLILIGGATIAGGLVRLGLVDEHHVFTHPVLLGGGQRLYPALDVRIELQLVEARPFGGGVVLHRHVPRSA